MNLAPQTYWADQVWTGGAVRAGVVIATDRAGRISSVRSGVPDPPVGAVSLRGLTIPGLANAHSHAFHRALRGVSQARDTTGGGAHGSFWTWRETMYAVAERLTPDSYFELARAVYAEMAMAGITTVGEFHYLHHAPGGLRYRDPNAMGEALIAAATEAGIRITLLDTCYLAGGFGRPPIGPQLRFSDGTADTWAERAAALAPSATSRIGAAVHSVRAVPAEQLATVAEWARERSAPLHVHLSEQPRENEECLAAHGRTPTRLLADHGLLGPGTTAVHATHPTEADIGLLGGSATAVCLCPSTERDLADGIGPGAALRDAGSPVCLGSDSHAMIDLLAETRAVELGERMRTRRRGHWSADALLAAATEHGQAALGWPDAGRLEPGAPADFTTVALDSVRTAGPPVALAAETVIFAATAADVRHTVVAGRHVVRDGVHQTVPHVAASLAEAIAPLCTP
ncbi:formimidoylglutamate deiminase [Streptomyces aidingensis]|uniref:Formiminoglutamate deiminase n=1 Tax=Streptomyces aidingensis TaxID=910347 RepID=A0A1I1GMF7_9ACTN|nr:formimidoylglutamate deiminase [Streptomyces aidingensis]SFC12979.1 formiminoglutamate deiminase [Streptomyces aidingensis]